VRLTPIVVQQKPSGGIFVRFTVQEEHAEVSSLTAPDSRRSLAGLSEGVGTRGPCGIASCLGGDGVAPSGGGRAGQRVNVRAFGPLHITCDHDTRGPGGPRRSAPSADLRDPVVVPRTCRPQGPARRAHLEAGSAKELPRPRWRAMFPC
jgi:hypothetical protein